MLRVHRRHRTLQHVLFELRRYRDELGINVRAHALLDRPTPQVRRILSAFRDVVVATDDAPTPLVDHKLSFAEAARFQHRRLSQLNPDWVLFQDDDRWLEPLRADEDLAPALEDDNVDLWYAQSLFVWDEPDTVNLARWHQAPVLFRYRPWDNFPTDRELQAPLPLHDEAIARGRTGLLDAPLLDYGSYSAEERDHLYAAFTRAGKSDKYIDSLLEPPRPASLTKELGPWVDLWTGTFREPDAPPKPL